MSQQSGRRSCSRSSRSTRWWPSQTTKTNSGTKRLRKCCRLMTARVLQGGWLPLNIGACGGRVVVRDVQRGGTFNLPPSAPPRCDSCKHCPFSQWRCRSGSKSVSPLLRNVVMFRCISKTILCFSYLLLTVFSCFPVASLSFRGWAARGRSSTSTVTQSRGQGRLNWILKFYVSSSALWWVIQ